MRSKSGLSQGNMRSLLPTATGANRRIRKASVIAAADRAWDDFFATAGVEVVDRDQPAAQVRESF